MKRILAIAATILCVIVCYAHNDVIKFLGFPVDGSKSEMIRNLETKGFKLSTIGDTDVLRGRFNGNDVHVYISTENGKVSRITVCDENYVNESDIKIRFNRLCSQFSANDKYLHVDDYTIPEDEDISYGMKVNHKRYEAIFYQLPQGEALEQMRTSILKDIQSEYTTEQLESITDEKRNEIIVSSAAKMLAILKNKPVWFMISEHYGKYYITMYYDNEYNRANGEDL